MKMYRRLLMLGLCLVWLCAVVARAQTGAGQSGQTQTGQSQTGQASARVGLPRPLDPTLLNLTSAGPNRADEPFAKRLSLEKTRNFLDEMAVNWTREKKCGTCHTNIAYMIGRAALGPHTPATDEVRNFFASRAARWDSMGNELVRGDVDKSKGWGLVTWFHHEVIVTAAMLAMDDAGTTGTLQPITRQVLDRMWTLQRQDGGWYWLMAVSQPFETSEYYGNALAAVAVAMAPDDYAKTPAAQKGLQKLRTYLALKNNSAVDLHDRIYVLWAASRIPDLITTDERDEILKKLLALQRPDGGWNFPSLGNWKREDGTANDKDAPSDGYGTGLVTYVLRQTGMPASDPILARAVNWLKTNQRESGRWFTRSINKDSYHFISHTGTVYAAMALKACGVTIENTHE
jgi:squalene-hopene/tetraprenyl-beta-curcumene cyclase